MNINRHNYETFFLLYVDNELSAAERKAVEQFVMENPDLKAELQSFIDVTLPEDMVRFETKENLYRSSIDREVLQENLLLHLDGELDTADAARITAIIASDDPAKKEWEILQLTKLDAGEKIVFADKRSLYRYERDRVISMGFWRIAAAAAILVAFLYTGVTLLRNDKPADNSTAGTKDNSSKQEQTGNKTGIAVNSNDSKQTTGAHDQAETNPGKQENQQNTTKNLALNNDEIKDNKPVFTEKNNPASNIADNSNRKNNTINRQPLAPNRQSGDHGQSFAWNEKNKKQKPALENINNNQRNETIASNVLKKNNDEVIQNKAPENVTASVQLKDKITTPKAPVIDYNSVMAAPNEYAKTASLDELNEKNDSKVLYMDQEKVAKTKLGGFLRKVKRVIERNANIKTGNGVSIAGFEIAVK